MVEMIYDIIDSPMGPILVAMDQRGVRHLSFEGGTHPLGIDPGWTRDPKKVKPVMDQLVAYFAGKLTQFEVDLAPLGTAFQQKVWAALCRIPYGRTASYLDVAVAVGNEKACRAVGGANGKNPIPIIIPCHRVIGKSGKLVGFSSGLDIKTRLLQLESRAYSNGE
ncbi:Ogt [Desulforapulum autotrophicum HRM2]|uniref:Methylated-DNA--protein-cysteine methyltransferase n=1 Tax=Desulforapulum autotrophicum (strain ATCC 43914 / DSM 3382 / VKM B-1955 / HRM2) TaxID=177437 RepID=C0QIN9_DESAH|nr:methylated-DNA--[protein]-cysteine S-methyltransferase [Desulforapulum autotrophicum]ACN17983.1 Ogt [Desulforapulum autotrophicum HRM2]